jgi:phospholipid/cholesterol/gamma-HCH transport system substrate-binding protein
VDNDTTRNLRLRLAIDASLRDQIRGDSKAKVRTLGLLGDKVIDISIGTPRYGVLREGDTIAVAPALDYEAVLAQAAGAVTDMVDLTRDLRKLTGGILAGEGTVGQLMTNRALYDQFVGTMSRANSMLTKFENPNGTVAHLLDDPTLYNRFVTLIGTADSLVVALNNKDGTIGKLLRDDSLYTHFVGMAQAGDSLMKVLSNGQGPLARFMSDPTLYDRLNKLTTDLGAILADVQKDPGRYMKGIICVFRCK